MSYYPLSYLSTSPLAFTITCNVADVAQHTAILLKQYGFQDNPSACVELILDVPLGFALTARTLGSIHPQRHHHRKSQ